MSGTRVVNLNKAQYIRPMNFASRPNLSPNPNPNPNPSTSPGMSIRKLNVDLSQGFGRRWYGGDAFKTAYYNALSMSFPAGEQKFIDSVKAVAHKLPQDDAHAKLRQDVQDFCAQEATHRHVHAQYNAQLDAQGFVNHLEPRILRRFEAAKDINPMHHLGVTVAYEHYTGVFTQAMLAHPNMMAGAEPAMKNVWMWHCLEETEHKAVAFDVYTALGGNTKWRRRHFVYVSVMFALDTMRQTTHNLRMDGALFKPSTWLSAARFFFGKTGLVWLTAKPLLDFWRADFHPWQHNNLAVAGGYAHANAGDWRLIR